MNLDQRLADVLEEAHVLERNGGAFSVSRVREIVHAIRTEDAVELLTFVSEPQAMLRSGHAKRWFQQRFRMWEKLNLARLNARKEREYCQLIVPLADDETAIRESAREAARQAS